MNAIRTLLATCMAVSATAASAATIGYGGVPATGGGFTTALTGPGVTTETFNGTTGGCGPTTGVAITGNYHIVTGSQPGYYAAPAGDGTCYLSIPQNGGSGQAQLGSKLRLALAQGGEGTFRQIDGDLSAHPRGELGHDGARCNGFLQCSMNPRRRRSSSRKNSNSAA